MAAKKRQINTGLLDSVTADMLGGEEFGSFGEDNSLRVESILIDLVRPNPLQARRILPQRIYTEFHSGKMTPSQALRDLIRVAQLAASQNSRPFTNVMELLGNPNDDSTGDLPALTAEEQLLRDLVNLAVTQAERSKADAAQQQIYVAQDKSDAWYDWRDAIEMHNLRVGAWRKIHAATYNLQEQLRQMDAAGGGSPAVRAAIEQQIVDIHHHAQTDLTAAMGQVDRTDDILKQAHELDAQPTHQNTVQNSHIMEDIVLNTHAQLLALRGADDPLVRNLGYMQYLIRSARDAGDMTALTQHIAQAAAYTSVGNKTIENIQNATADAQLLINRAETWRAEREIEAQRQADEREAIRQQAERDQLNEQLERTNDYRKQIRQIEAQQRLQDVIDSIPNKSSIIHLGISPQQMNLEEAQLYINQNPTVMPIYAEDVNTRTSRIVGIEDPINDTTWVVSSNQLANNIDSTETSISNQQRLNLSAQFAIEQVRHVTGNLSARQLGITDGLLNGLGIFDTSDLIINNTVGVIDRSQNMGRGLGWTQSSDFNFHADRYVSRVLRQLGKKD